MIDAQELTPVCEQACPCKFPAEPSPTGPRAVWPYLDLPIEEVMERVSRRCEQRLARYPGLDPADATQEVMVRILRRDFASRFNPLLGDMLGFILGTADNTCRRMAQRWRRREASRSPIEIAGKIARARSPQDGAIYREILGDVRAARVRLSASEQASLQGVLDRASGSRGREPGERQNYSAACRCRARLRVLLIRHDPSR